MRSIFKKIGRGFLLGFKWILIQLFAVLVLLVCGFGTRSLWGWDKALILSIPIYTLLFSFWHVFVPQKRHRWMITFPWLIYMVFVYLGIARIRDWNFKIITVDQFMLGGWLAPVFGAGLHFLWFYLRKTLISQNKDNEKHNIS